MYMFIDLSHNSGAAFRAPRCCGRAVMMLWVGFVELAPVFEVLESRIFIQ